MREEVYNAIAAKLREEVPEVRHYSLWNHNVEFIEQEENWERPAVFIEFGPIDWKQYTNQALRGVGEIRLHIVEDWTYSKESDIFALSDRITAALNDLDGERFDSLTLMNTQTNHNHEELVESIETFGVRYLREMR